VSLQTLNGLYIPNPAISNVVSASSTLTIDAAGEKAATIFRVPHTGNISHVGFRVASVTSAQTLRCSLQTVSGTGDPTGTDYGGSAPGTQTPAANTAYSVALATPAAATLNDVVAIVVEFDSTPGNLAISAVGGGLSRKFPYGSLFTASWAPSTALTAMWVAYDDGSVYPMGTYPYSSYGGVSYNSGSSPDEYALRFQLPFPARVAGYWFGGGGNAAGSDFDVVLYDSSSVAIASDSWDGDLRSSNTAINHEGRFTSPVTINANEVYRLALKPTTANNITISRVIVLSAAVFGAHDGGTEFYLSTRTDAGAWTDSTTIRPIFGLILDQFDDGESGGGGGTPIFIFSE
jgi:hypothetical protein